MALNPAKTKNFFLFLWGGAWEQKKKRSRFFLSPLGGQRL
jgi:hypothetical protein